MKYHKKKRKTNKKLNIAIPLIIGLIILLLILKHPFKEKKEIKTQIIENLTFDEKPNSNQEVLSFYISNDYEEYADCYATLSLNNNSFCWNTGIIEPNSKKLIKTSIFMPNGNTNIKVDTNCQWREKTDTTECENSTFRICDTIKNDKSLKQCLNRNIPLQYFCIAIMKNDESYCDDIKILHRKTLCKAFIENKPELCENLEEWKDWCYQDYGINKKDKKACEKIENKDKKNSCMGVINHDIELCKNINKKDKFMCIINLAEFTKNKELCELLDDKENCYEELTWM